MLSNKKNKMSETKKINNGDIKRRAVSALVAVASLASGLLSWTGERIAEALPKNTK